MQHRKSTLALAAAAGLAALVAASGCSDDDADGSTSDAEESRAQTEAREAELAVIASASEMYPEAAGTATVTVEDGTTVELEVSGLTPDTAYTSHLHDAACDSEPPGGEHWLADPEAGMSEDNEIHLHLTTDAEGGGSVTVDSDLVADDRVESIVVHVADPEEGEGHEHMASDRVLCGDFG